MEAAGFQNHDDQDGPSIVDKLRPEEKNAAKLLIKNLTIDFDARNFENPTIQKFYSGLQALALNEDEPEQVDDLLEPDYEEMQRFQPVINKFKSAFFDGEDSDNEAQIAPKPRGRGGLGRGGRGRGAAASSQSSNVSQGRGRGNGVKSRQKVEPINEAALGDSDEEVRQPANSKKKLTAKDKINSSVPNGTTSIPMTRNKLSQQ